MINNASFEYKKFDSAREVKEKKIKEKHEKYVINHTIKK